MYQAAVHFVW